MKPKESVINLTNVSKSIFFSKSTEEKNKQANKQKSLLNPYPQIKKQNINGIIIITKHVVFLIFTQLQLCGE